MRWSTVAQYSYLLVCVCVCTDVVCSRRSAFFTLLRFWLPSFSSRPTHVALACDMREPALLAWALAIHAAAIQERGAAVQ